MLSQQIFDEAAKVAKQHLEGKLDVSISIEVLQKLLDDENSAHLFIVEFNNYLEKYRTWYGKQ